MSSESVDDESSEADDEFYVTAIMQWDVDEDDRLMYLCELEDGEDEWIDRSDLMDGAHHQKLVLSFERRHEIPWDPMCFLCAGEGCEECTCPDCERPCRLLRGTNYGCVMHPVV